MQVIFLCILKWIGIILAIILGVLLLLCLALLFVPVRYYIYGRYDEKKEYAFSVYWLLHLLSVRKRKTSDTVWVCVFGIPIKRLADIGGIHEREKKPKEKGKKEDRKECLPDIEKKETVTEEETARKPEEIRQKKLTTSKHKTDKKKRNKKAKKGKKLKRKRFSFSRLSSIINFIREKATKDTIRFLRGELFGLIKHISPRRICGIVRFGFSDPATTGIVLGIISLFPFAYQEGLTISPDFEEEVFEARGKAKGRIRVVRLCRIAIRVYRNRDVKKLVRRYKKLKEELSNGR